MDPNPYSHLSSTPVIFCRLQFTDDKDYDIHLRLPGVPRVGDGVLPPGYNYEVEIEGVTWDAHAGQVILKGSP